MAEGSLFSLNYSLIEDSISSARKTVSGLKDYVRHMQKVANDCNSLSGADSRGYVNSAVTLVRDKIRRANEEQTTYSSYAQSLEHLEDLAKQKDAEVALSIDVTVSQYVGTRKWWQKAGDAIYGLYVSFLDGVSSLGPVGKWLAQGIRVAGNWVSTATVSISNWFKYGDGKYVWNIAKPILGIIASVAGIVAAVAGIAAAAVPALIAIAVVGVIAGCVALVLSVVDAVASTGDNVKALSLAQKYKKSKEENSKKDDWWDTTHDQGSLSAARYFGGTDGIKSWIEKRDFGDAEANKKLEKVGAIHDTVRDISSLVSSVCSLSVSIGKTQYLKGYDGKIVKGLDGKGRLKNGSFFENIRTEYLDDLGAQMRTYSKTGKVIQIHAKNPLKQVYDGKKVFSLKLFDGYGKTFSKLGIGKSVGAKALIGLASGAKVVKNVDGLVSNVTTISDYMAGKKTGVSEGYEAVNATLDVLKNVSGFDVVLSDFTDATGIVENVVKGIAGPKKDSNLYRTYLAANGG